jgi:hypothetical protein
MGQHGRVSWPDRSSPLNPPDSFSFGELKKMVYDAAEERLQRVQNGCTSVRNTRGIFQRVRQSTHRRPEACVAVQGQQLEHLL